MTTDGFRYWGFISYSHRDRRWGERLHRQLESYRVPKRLIGSAGAHGPVPARLFPIFHDRAELSTSAGLSEMLTRAIEASRFFIVICSPQAAASRWVNEEIRHAKRCGRADRILCLIVDGEPYATDQGRPERECFPPALRYEVGPAGELPTRAPEPLAADLRAGGDGRDDARLKLIAGLLGVGFDTLRRRDLQARNRRLGLVAGSAVLISIAMAALAVRAVIAEHAADNARQRGEDLIDFMLGDLRDKLEPLGKLDILDAVGDRAMAYFEHLDSRNLGEAALVARAKALRQIGDVRFQQGQPADAAAAFDAALALNRRIAAAHPADADLQFELAQAEFWAGYSAWRAGQNDRAEPHFLAYRRIAQGLVASAPANPKWQLEVAYAEGALGALESGRHRYADALAHFEAETAAARAIADPGDEVRAELAGSLSWQGTTLQLMGRAQEAVAVLQRQAELEQARSDARPDDYQRLFEHGASLSALAGGALDAGQPAIAGPALDAGQAIAARLISNDPSNAEYRALDARFVYLRAALLADDGDVQSTRALLDRAGGILATLRRQAPDDERLNGLQASVSELAFGLSVRLKDWPAAAAALETARRQCQAGSASGLACSKLALRDWELAASRGLDSNAARQAAETALAAADATDAGKSAEELRFRALVLNGDHETARQYLDKLTGSGYCPVDLRLFLQRYGYPACGVHATRADAKPE